MSKNTLAKIAAGAVAVVPTLAFAKTMQELIDNLTSAILDPLTGILILLATIFFLWGLIEYIAGAASEDKRTQGKEHMLWGILGLVIIFGAKGIISVIKNFFV